MVIELLVREFEVDVPLERAWDHLARVENWPSWAKHIKRVTLEPPGLLTETSAGAFRLAGGARSTFRMEVYDPPRRWQPFWLPMFLERPATAASLRTMRRLLRLPQREATPSVLV